MTGPNADEVGVHEASPLAADSRFARSIRKEIAVSVPKSLSACAGRWRGMNRLQDPQTNAPEETEEK